MPTHTAITKNAAQKLHGALEAHIHEFAAQLAEESAAPHLAEIKNLKLEMSARHDAHMTENGKLQDTLQSVRDSAQSLREENTALNAAAEKMQRELYAKDAQIAALKEAAGKAEQLTASKPDAAQP